MRRKRDNSRDEVRERFERHIATELAAKADVDTGILARDFFAKEGKILRGIADAMLLQMLVKWADDILGGSVGTELAKNGHGQLVLPFGLEGIEVPGGISFISGSGKIKFVAQYKVVGWQVESHGYILRKKAQESNVSSAQWDRLTMAVKPFMDADPKLTLPIALRMVAESGGSK